MFREKHAHIIKNLGVMLALIQSNAADEVVQGCAALIKTGVTTDCLRTIVVAMKRHMDAPAVAAAGCTVFYTLLTRPTATRSETQLANEHCRHVGCVHIVTTVLIRHVHDADVAAHGCMALNELLQCWIGGLYGMAAGVGQRVQTAILPVLEAHICNVAVVRPAMRCLARIDMTAEVETIDRAVPLMSAAMAQPFEQTEAACVALDACRVLMRMPKRPAGPINRAAAECMKLPISSLRRVLVDVLRRHGDSVAVAYAALKALWRFCGPLSARVLKKGTDFVDVCLPLVQRHCLEPDPDFGHGEIAQFAFAILALLKSDADVMRTVANWLSEWMDEWPDSAHGAVMVKKWQNALGLRAGRGSAWIRGLRRAWMQACCANQQSSKRQRVECRDHTLLGVVLKDTIRMTIPSESNALPSEYANMVARFL